MALPTSVLSLFAGGGGLDLGLSSACGARSVCYVEREAFAAAVLVARMEDGSLAAAPIWSDVTVFDGRPWRGIVDCVAGGSPCRDMSITGKHAGLDGKQSGLFWELVRIVGEVRPEWVFWENVAGARKFLPRIFGAFESLGYSGAAVALRASDVGAPHRRERIFLLAHNPEHGRREGRTELVELGEGLDAARCSDPMADANKSRCTGNPFPPGPKDVGAWREYLERWPEAQPAIRRGTDGISCELDRLRTHRLRVLGNAVVPAQAKAAFLFLLGEVGDT